MPFTLLLSEMDNRAERASCTLVPGINKLRGDEPQKLNEQHGRNTREQECDHARMDVFPSFHALYSLDRARARETAGETRG